ncbi:MAG: hypothetical protein NW223_03655 [Hyphomicrobiaceae bacterium]|nr:hypothetical protein [Hyphomicrobiaceae bacterium]
MNRVVVIAIVCAAAAFVACRREVPYEPLKLGAGDVHVQRPAR